MLTMPAASVALRVRALGPGPQPRLLRRQEAAEVLAAAALRIDALRDQPGAQLAGFQRLVDRGIHLVEDGLGRAAGREQAAPVADHEVLEAQFLRRRDVR